MDQRLTLAKIFNMMSKGNLTILLELLLRKITITRLEIATFDNLEKHLRDSVITTKTLIDEYLAVKVVEMCVVFDKIT